MASERADTGSATEALKTGRRVIRAERAGLDALADSLDPVFAEAVALIGAASGRLIVCGVGKSGHVARKVSSTFASTGTPSFFLHAAEAGHGDLGIIGADDVLMILSNSGQSRELLPVLQFAQRRGLPLIAVTSDAGSDLAQAAGCLLRLPPVAEADPAIPAPTTSALMMLALGDALAAALWHGRGFSADDFSRLHPSGRLGAALARVGDLLDGLPPAPQVTPYASLREIAEAITRGGLGCALVRAHTPFVHIFLGIVGLGEKLFSRQSHIHGRHHIPVLVLGVHKKGHVRHDGPPVNQRPTHRHPGHVLHATDKNNIGKLLGNFFSFQKRSCCGLRCHRYVDFFHEFTEFFTVFGNVYRIDIYPNKFYIKVFPDSFFICFYTQV